MSTDHDRTAGNPRRMPERYVGLGFDANPLLAEDLYEGIRTKRVLAYLLDVCILLALGFAWWGIGIVLSVLTLFASWPLVVTGAVLLPIAYHSYMVGTERHATFGMRALGIRVVAWNGNDPTLLQAFLQTVLFYATMAFTNGLILLVSCFNKQGRCLHDYLCGTVVVNEMAMPAAAGRRI
jgi:uncharacterized RDD family membrane protein YckC